MGEMQNILDRVFEITFSEGIHGLDAINHVNYLLLLLLKWIQDSIGSYSLNSEKAISPAVVQGFLDYIVSDSCGITGFEYGQSPNQGGEYSGPSESYPILKSGRKGWISSGISLFDLLSLK